MHFERTITTFLSRRDDHTRPHILNQDGSQNFQDAKTYQGDFPSTTQQSTPLPTSQPWKYPMIDRTVLDKLDLMHDFFAQDHGPFHDQQKDTLRETRLRWPPVITRIPERPSRPPISIGVGSPNGDGQTRPPQALASDEPAICDSSGHPRPCRFLLPLRIAEQESKARMHITQLAELARRLNRTLVLPNVGKSKIGACFRWPFSVYYEPSSINLDDAWRAGVDAVVDDAHDKGKESYVELESFHAWMESYARNKRRESLKSQLVSIAPTILSSGLRDETIYANTDVAVHAYSTFGAWERDLPGCFSTKFHHLRLETRPIYIYPITAAQPAKKDGRDKFLGDSIVDALSTISSGTSGEPPVLVVNWDMRYPVFAPPPPHATIINKNAYSSLQYSAKMHDLAKQYAPAGPYLAIQWRMETVDVHLLQDCAHALVDVLVRVLHDPSLSENVTTVWFATDYPYPIARRTKAGSRPPMISAKSGTFRDFDILHENAIEILRKAFDKQGELHEWKLTDFAEAIENDSKPQNELLHDTGVLGILDKLVSTNAAIFVSGSSRCSRKRCVSDLTSSLVGVLM
ncbi:hypothetical protein JR316_0005587 [Psilocybe cubensis]|uniref:Uncharacterized protein n=2 Tax=Psilocybe cubensis TaxID=181762 RepID=A0A8H8CMA3_PSICU|nr:hypothetical protein JR316_0005587 [Psilocybe cubensis]KAH9481068.1 hypothetical protein JR316_0005587 [Psilocybe cubensis]